MNNFITQLKIGYKNLWANLTKVTFTKIVGFFMISLVIQHFANQYVGQVAGMPVGDIILSNIPTADTDFFVIQGALLFTFLMIGILIWKPRYILFTVASLSLFIIIRSFFISLTHLGVDPHEIVLDTNSLGFGLYNILFNSSSDFFFSGHTGIPFLMGLIFWYERFWGKLFFVVSFVLGLSVLLGHIHYSIDVFAAPFITYTIFIIAQKIFPKEYNLTKTS